MVLNAPGRCLRSAGAASRTAPRARAGVPRATVRPRTRRTGRPPAVYARCLPGAVAGPGLQVPAGLRAALVRTGRDVPSPGGHTHRPAALAAVQPADRQRRRAPEEPEFPDAPRRHGARAAL